MHESGNIVNVGYKGKKEGVHQEIFEIKHFQVNFHFSEKIFQYEEVFFLFFFLMLILQLYDILFIMFHWSSLLLLG